MQQSRAAHIIFRFYFVWTRLAIVYTPIKFYTQFWLKFAKFLIVIYKAIEVRIFTAFLIKFLVWV